MTKSITTCPKCGNEMVYRVPSAAREPECVYCPKEIGYAEEPTPLHRAAWDLSAAIANGDETFQPLMRFAEEIRNVKD